MIFTKEYLETAAHAELEITYPDGIVWRTRALADGNGTLVASVRDAIEWPRGRAVIDCSRNLDRLRKSHEEALEREPDRASSLWVNGGTKC